MTYSTVAQVRANTVQQRYYVTNVTGTTITLPDSHTTSIVEVKKNNILILADGYEFKPPNKLVLDTAAVATDFFEIVRGNYLTTAELQEIIDDGDDIIDSILITVYTMPFSAPFPLPVEALSRKIARAKVIIQLAGHQNYNIKQLELEQAEKSIKSAMETLKLIQSGEMDLIDPATNTPIARKTNYRNISTNVGIDDSVEGV